MKFPKTLVGIFTAAGITAVIVPPVYQMIDGKLSWNAFSPERHPGCLSGAFDAAIIFEGGARRSSVGVDVLRNSRRINPEFPLFVSDSYEHGLFNGIIDPLERNVAIDYMAENTIDNAEISAQWIKTNGYNSVCLITDDYHMARSIFELKAAAPDLKEVAAYPVFDSTARNNEKKKLACRIYENFVISAFNLRAKAGDYCYQIKSLLFPEPAT